MADNRVVDTKRETLSSVTIELDRRTALVVLAVALKTGGPTSGPRGSMSGEKGCLLDLLMVAFREGGETFDTLASIEDALNADLRLRDSSMAWQFQGNEF